MTEQPNLARIARQILEILTGLPDGTGFEDACRIKAAQGDKLAQQALRHFDSRRYRVFDALFQAAVDIHPGWKRLKKKGAYQKDEAAPQANALVEWFQKTHPREARAIEDAIE